MAQDLHSLLYGDNTDSTLSSGGGSSTLSNLLYKGTPPPPLQTSQPAPVVQPQPNLIQQAGNVLGDIGNVVKQTAKQVVDFIPQAPSYAKAVKEKPLESIAGGGEAVLTAFGSLAGLVQQGVASVAKVNIPERWDISKQTRALKELDDQLLQKSGVDEQKAFETGRFLGAFLPYALGGEVVGATVGAKLLTPLASKFLPGATKFIPTINNAIGFLGVGQIEHDPQNGTRVDQLKNDLIMLSMFEVGGVVAKGLSQGTKNLISKTLNEVKNKPKIDFETVQPKIEEVKAAIKADTGKTPEVIVATEMAEGKAPKIETPKPTRPLAEEARKYKSGVKTGQPIQTPATIKPNEKIPQTESSQTAKTAEDIQTQKVEAGKSENQANQGQVPEGKTPLKPLGEGETKTSALGESVAQKAKEKRLADLTEDVPTYKQLNMKDQLKKADDLVASDLEKAKKVAFGEELPPQGLTPEAVYVSLENKAFESGDIDLIRKLANSNLTSEGTAMGQRIRVLAERDPESPVAQIQAVKDARTQAVEKKTGKDVKQATQDTVKEIKSKVKTPDKYDWGRFLEEIKCK